MLEISVLTVLVKDIRFLIRDIGFFNLWYSRNRRIRICIGFFRFKFYGDDVVWVLMNVVYILGLCDD